MLLQLLCIAALTTGALSQTAICDMVPDPELDTGLYPDQVFGTVTFFQEGNVVNISMDLSGFVPDDGIFVHGFHIHESDDLTFGCASTGGDYNPRDEGHGLPTEIIRHVGDLGNIQEDDAGEVMTTFTDDVITLNGGQSIIGRAAVIHASVDLGNSGNDEHGQAGALLACCIITEVVEEAF